MKDSDNLHEGSDLIRNSRNTWRMEGRSRLFFGRSTIEIAYQNRVEEFNSTECLGNIVKQNIQPISLLEHLIDNSKGWE